MPIKNKNNKKLVQDNKIKAFTMVRRIFWLKKTNYDSVNFIKVKSPNIKGCKIKFNIKCIESKLWYRDKSKITYLSESLWDV